MFGIEFYKSDGSLALSSNERVLYYRKRVRINIQARAYLGSSGVLAVPELVSVFGYDEPFANSKTIDSKIQPMVFIDNQSSLYAGISFHPYLNWFDGFSQQLYDSNSDVQLLLLGTGQAGEYIDVFIFYPFNPISVSGYGIAVYDDNGDVQFTDKYMPLLAADILPVSIDSTYVFALDGGSDPQYQYKNVAASFAPGVAYSFPALNCYWISDGEGGSQKDEAVIAVLPRKASTTNLSLMLFADGDYYGNETLVYKTMHLTGIDPAFYRGKEPLLETVTP